MSRKDTYDSVVAMGFEGKRRVAYDYMNKLVAYYGLEISIFKSISADEIQKRKRIQEYDYVTRTELFKFLWMDAELPPEYKVYIFGKHPQFYELNILH